MAREVIRLHGTLEIDEDPDFQNATWRAERVAWVVFALLLLAALVGVFGHGPFSRGEARAADGAFSVEYPRVARLDSADDFQLRFRPTADTSVVELDGDFARAFLVENVKPQPARQRSRGDHTLLLEFDATPGQQQTVYVDVRPRRAAFPARASVRVDDAAPLELSTVVLP